MAKAHQKESFVTTAQCLKSKQREQNTSDHTGNYLWKLLHQETTACNLQVENPNNQFAILEIIEQLKISTIRNNTDSIIIQRKRYVDSTMHESLLNIEQGR